MPRTPYRDYPLYADDAAPDLTATGEYNQAVEAIDSDMHGEIETRISEDTRIEGLVTTETSERKAADSTLGAKIAKEVADRGSADNALSSRIDNAEAEISANSADLTGIKSLTYGTGQQVFLENDNGSYSSPALEEIQHEIEQAAKNKGLAIVDVELNQESGPPNFDDIKTLWPNLIAHAIDPYVSGDKGTYYWPAYITSDGENYRFVGLDNYLECNANWVTQYSTALNWRNVSNKPFSTIGSGLKVVSNALTVDTAALPTGESEIFTVTTTDSETPTLSATFAEMLAAYNASKLVVLRAGSLVMPLSSTITGGTGEISSLMFSLLIGGTTGESVATYFTLTVSSANKIDIKQGVIPDKSAQALTKSDLANITWGALEAAIVVPT